MLPSVVVQAASAARAQQAEPGPGPYGELASTPDENGLLLPAGFTSRVVAVAGERIRAYEDRVHPWLDTSTPASALASLMQEHGLRQGDLPEVGSQGVVSEVLSGKRPLNARQIAQLAKRFSVPADVFLP